MVNLGAASGAGDGRGCMTESQDSKLRFWITTSLWGVALLLCGMVLKNQIAYSEENRQIAYRIQAKVNEVPKEIAVAIVNAIKIHEKTPHPDAVSKEVFSLSVTHFDNRLDELKAMIKELAAK